MLSMFGKIDFVVSLALVIYIPVSFSCIGTPILVFYFSHSPESKLMQPCLRYVCLYPYYCLTYLIRNSRSISTRYSLQHSPYSYYFPQSYRSHLFHRYLLRTQSCQTYPYDDIKFYFVHMINYASDMSFKASCNLRREHVS